MKEAENDKKNKTVALFGTVAVHGILVALFFIFGFRTPLPLPEEQGIAINFGFDDSGSGLEEPEVTGSENPSEAASSASAPSNVNSATQDVEEAVAVTNKPNKTTNDKVEKSVENPANKPATETKPTVNPRALYPGKTTGGSQGNTGGAGNMGNPNGNPNTNGAGAGLDGSGEFNLAGRQFVKRPSLSDKTQQEGKIVVFIWVDPEGNVTRSQAGAKGTSIGNRDLWEKCEAAALNAKFSVAENAPAEQRGTLTFIFSFQ